MGVLKKQKIIVTGGTGFIGSHLVKELIDLGAEVLVIDIRLHPKSYFALEKLQNKVELEFIDIAKKSKIGNLFDLYKPHYVFHLAAEAIVDRAYDDPYRTFQTNVMGTVSILEAVRTSKNIKGIIVASSDKAYGKTKKTYTEDSPLKGDHPYDVSKSATDLITQTYHNTFGIPTVITRFGNVYGEGDLNFSRVVPGVMKAIVNNEMLEIRSDGKYVRDYLYVKDVVLGYTMLLDKIDSVKGEAFNFSSSDKLTVLEMIKKLEKYLKTRINYKILNISRNEIPYQHLNDNKVRKLGWDNKYDISDVVHHIEKWYRKVV